MLATCLPAPPTARQSRNFGPSRLPVRGCPMRCFVTSRWLSRRHPSDASPVADSTPAGLDDTLRLSLYMRSSPRRNVRVVISAVWSMDGFARVFGDALVGHVGDPRGHSSFHREGGDEHRG